MTSNFVTFNVPDCIESAEYHLALAELTSYRCFACSELLDVAMSEEVMEITAGEVVDQIVVGLCCISCIPDA